VEEVATSGVVVDEVLGRLVVLQALKSACISNLPSLVCGDEHSGTSSVTIFFWTI
jgi:hypothetical protein